MSDYTKSTDFASKDSLPAGNSGKIVKGTEIDTEFNNIATAIATKADSANPSFSGTAAFATLTATSATINSATVSGGSITGITDLAVADGGTGASTAANARANLGTVADTAANGIAARTAANTLTARTITAGTGISVSDGDGVSGNPTISNTGVTTVNGSSGAVSVYVGPTSSTQQNLSGTSVDFSSVIPSWAKRITILINSAVPSANSVFAIQLITGTSTIVSTGYVGLSSAVANGSTTCVTSSTTRFSLNSTSTNGYSGIIQLLNISGNIWIHNSNSNNLGGLTFNSSGTVDAGAALTGIRITTVAGTATFSSGTANIIYE